jgi:hypothetical protein
MMILGSKPMLTKLDNNMLLFNEFMVSIYLYNLLCLTDYMGEHDQRDLIAWVLLCIVILTVIVNLVKFLLVCDWCYPIRKINEKCCKNKWYESEDKFDDLNGLNGDTAEKYAKNKIESMKKMVKKKKKKQGRPSK